MDQIITFVQFFLHIDQHLQELATTYGSWATAILFLIVFCETGLVVTPFLPGDSLLFAAGALAAGGFFEIGTIIIALLVAAILGDAVNYSIGAWIGPKVFERESRWIKREYLIRTQKFFDTYGGKAIVIARFVPIVRTFAPFLAGVGQMQYRRFGFYNISGAVLWVFSITLAGYYFGTLEIVKKNFSLVVLAIIFISLIPVFIEAVKIRAERQQGKAL